MSELEILSLVFTYEWKLTGVENKPMSILSKTIKFGNEMFFRAGLKNTARPTLFFITVNLNKMGIKVSNASYISSTLVDDSQLNVQRKIMKLENEQDDNGSVQLFTANSLKDIVTGDRKFVFQINLVGVVKGFHIQRMDCILSEQLWSSRAIGSDFGFVAGKGEKFPVHKFILAARSSVFAALFGNEADQESYSLFNKRPKMNTTSLREIHESVDATSMEQFLKFIYTGQLDGLVSYCEELKYLAKKYQIQTLEEICDAVTDQVDGSQLALFPLRWKLDKGKAPLRIAPDEDIEFDFSDISGVFSFTLNLKEDEEEEEAETFSRSKAVCHLNEVLFRLVAKISKPSKSKRCPISL